MDSSKKTTFKLTIKKNRFKGSLHRRIFLKINTTFNSLIPDVNKEVTHT